MDIKARIRRNKLDELAGEFYQDSDSDFVKHLQAEGKPVLVGLKRDEKVYTILGNDATYYRTPSGVQGEITHKKLLKILQDTALRTGKLNDFEFIEIEKGVSIWFMNTNTMLAMWNTILLLEMD